MVQPVASVGFGEEDVVRPPDVFDRLAQDSARQHVAVAEGIGGVHQHDVDVRLEHEILKAVVENDDVGLVLIHGVQPRLDPVLVDQHGDVAQIRREHVGFIAGVVGFEQQIVPVGDHLGRHLDLLRAEHVHELVAERAFAAAVAAAENRHLAPLRAERAREYLHHRRLAGAAAGEVADADHETAERVVADHPLVVHPEAELNRHPVKARRHEQQIDQHPVEPAAPAAGHQIEKILLDLLRLEREMRMHTPPMRNIL